MFEREFGGADLAIDRNGLGDDVHVCDRTDADHTDPDHTDADHTDPDNTVSAPATKANPVVSCPVLKAGASPQTPLSCTSATVIGASAARIGLKYDGDGPTILSSLFLLSYTRTVLLPIAYRRAVYIYHYKNGAVPSLLCSGVVAKTLDPALSVCTDLGASTRTDRPTVRAWALRAEATVTKSAKAQPTLTSGSLTFVACVDPSFPKGGGSIAFQMNLYVQHSGAKTYSSDCNR